MLQLNLWYLKPYNQTASKLGLACGNREPIKNCECFAVTAWSLAIIGHGDRVESKDLRITGSLEVDYFQHNIEFCIGRPEFARS